MRSCATVEHSTGREVEISLLCMKDGKVERIPPHMPILKNKAAASEISLQLKKALEHVEMPVAVLSFLSWSGTVRRHYKEHQEQSTEDGEHGDGCLRQRQCPLAIGICWHW